MNEKSPTGKCLPGFFIEFKTENIRPFLQAGQGDAEKEGLFCKFFSTRHRNVRSPAQRLVEGVAGNQGTHTTESCPYRGRLEVAL